MGIRTAIRGRMFQLGRRGLRVDITGRGARYFLDKDEFSDFLEQSRRPSKDLEWRAHRWDQRRIEREIARSETLARGLLDTLILVAENKRPPDALWRELDIGVVPDENHWPSILFACNFDTTPSEFGRAAIETFLEFLRLRKQLLRDVLMKRPGAGEYVETRETGLDEVDLEAANAWLAKDINRIESITRAAMTRERKYRRLPYDMPVSIRLQEFQVVTLFLARWKVSLEWRGRELSFHQDSETFLLHPGKNTIGRAPGCDVTLQKAPLDVSRTHLVVDWRGRGEVVVRDISMKGSWLPRNLVAFSDE